MPHSADANTRAVPLFSLMDGAAVSICVQVLVRVSVFIAFRSRIAGSDGHSQCSFLRSYQTFLHGCTLYILTGRI